MISTKKNLKVTDLNPFLICVLCKGYYIDATTIVECLHSFCKTCIVKYLKKHKYCPICDVLVYKTKPLQNIRPDQRLQNVVYKLIPGLYEREMQRRQVFFSTVPVENTTGLSGEDRGIITENSEIILPDENISITLEYLAQCTDDINKAIYGRRYLRCKASAPVSILDKFLRNKFNLSNKHCVELVCNNEKLTGHMSVMDVAYIYQWKKKTPMYLGYRILEAKIKRISEQEDTENIKRLKLSNEKPWTEMKHPVAAQVTPFSRENENIPGVQDVKRENGDNTSNAKSHVNMLRSDVNRATNGSVNSSSLNTSSANIGRDSLNNKSEWKEVELKINDDGEMRATVLPHSLNNNMSHQSLPCNNNELLNLSKQAEAKHRDNPESQSNSRTANYDRAVNCTNQIVNCSSNQQVNFSSYQPIISSNQTVYTSANQQIISSNQTVSTSNYPTVHTSANQPVNSSSNQLISSSVYHSVNSPSSFSQTVHPITSFNQASNSNVTHTTTAPVTLSSEASLQLPKSELTVTALPPHTVGNRALVYPMIHESRAPSHNTYNNPGMRIPAPRGRPRAPSQPRFKTLRGGVQPWNPTVSRSKISIGNCDPLKPADSVSKIFKSRNARFLNNPSPPGNTQESPKARASGNIQEGPRPRAPHSALTKVDPRTLSPIVPVSNMSPLVPVSSISPVSSGGSKTDSPTYISSPSSPSHLTQDKLNNFSRPNPFLHPSLFYPGFLPYGAASDNPLLPNSPDFMKAMSALYQQNPAFHSSLPPSISTLFNHHLPSQNEKKNSSRPSAQHRVSPHSPSTTPPNYSLSNLPSSISVSPTNSHVPASLKSYIPLNSISNSKSSSVHKPFSPVKSSSSPKDKSPTTTVNSIFSPANMISSSKSYSPAVPQPLSLVTNTHPVTTSPSTTSERLSTSIANDSKTSTNSTKNVSSTGNVKSSTPSTNDSKSKLVAETKPNRKEASSNAGSEPKAATPLVSTHKTSAPSVNTTSNTNSSVLNTNLSSSLPNTATLNSSVPNTTLNSSLPNTTLNSSIANTTVNSSVPNSNLNSSISNTTVNSSVPNTTLNNSIGNTTVNSSVSNTTLNSSISNTTPKSKPETVSTQSSVKISVSEVRRSDLTTDKMEKSCESKKEPKDTPKIVMTNGENNNHLKPPSLTN